MTISQERSVLSTVAADQAEFATVGARRGRDCPWLVQGEIQRAEGARETLFIIAEPTEPTLRGGMGAKFIAAIRDVYAASTHDDPIVALTGAIEAANDALYHSNRTTAPGSRVVLGLTCLLVRDQDLIICQVPPTQLILEQNGAPVILPSFDTWRANYQPHTDGDHQGLGATDTATPQLYRAVLEEGDLLVLCSSNLARLLSAEEEGDLGPLLGSDPHLATEFLHDLAERNGLDPAYGIAIAPLPTGDTILAGARRDADDDMADWDEMGERSAPPQAGERWLDRSLREMRDWSRIIPWPRRGGGRVVPLRVAHGGTRPMPETLPDEASPAPVAQHGYDPEEDGSPHDERAHEPVTTVGALPDADDDPAYANVGMAGHAAEYPDDDDDDDAADVRPSGVAGRRVAGRAARPRGSIGQTLGTPIAFGVLVLGSALERILPAGGRRRNEHFLERSRNRVWPLGNLERHASKGFRIGRALPLVALALLVILAVSLTVSVRSRQVRGEQQRFDAALATIAQQRETALAAPDKLAAYNQLLALPESLKAIAGAEKPGRAERVAAEGEAIGGALDRVAGVERLPAGSIQVAATLPNLGGAITGRPQVVAHGGQLYALLNGTVYGVDGRSQAMVRLLGKGDTINGVSVGQLLGIIWRVDALFAFTETHGFVRNAAGWNAIPLSATGRKAAAVESFDGNLYFLEPERGQIVKFASGSYAQAPQPWSGPRATTDLSLAVDFAIDVDIYILLSDGRILDYFQGELKTTFAPSTVPPFAGVSAITTAPGSRWLYVIDPKEGRIVRLGRDGNLAGVYKPAADAQALAGARDIAIDESTGTLYVLIDTGVVSVRLP